jgi:hypothetical protein
MHTWPVFEQVAANANCDVPQTAKKSIRRINMIIAIEPQMMRTDHSTTSQKKQPSLGLDMSLLMKSLVRYMCFLAGCRPCCTLFRHRFENNTKENYSHSQGLQ